MYFIRLSPVDKVRLVFANTTSADFVGILAPHLRDMPSSNTDGLFQIVGDPGGRSFRYYVNNDGDDFIINDQGTHIPVSKGRSLTGAIMDKLTNNEFTRKYQELKKAFNPFEDASNF